jgi:hypothetical protein
MQLAKMGVRGDTHLVLLILESWILIDIICAPSFYNEPVVLGNADTANLSIPIGCNINEIRIEYNWI